jgi:hypothetical protein
MSFEVMNPAYVTWMPVDYNGSTSQTCYVGQFVTLGATGNHSGVKPWVVAGAADTTTDVVPFGVVVGTNNRTPLYSSTYSAEYVTSVQSQANQVSRDTTGAEGMWSKGDPCAMVQVAVIGPGSIIKGKIFNATYGTAPTVRTVTTGSTTGAGFVAGAADFTPVAYNAYHHFRSGANMGIGRVGYDTSTTTQTVYIYYPYDIAIGDTLVSVNVGLGATKAFIDAAGMFIDTSAALTSHYIWAEVLKLELSTAGQEAVIFRLNPLQNLAVRA